MAADENRRKSFFDALVEDGYTFGKEESTERAAFDSLMNDPAWAKRTHKALVDDGWELDDFDTWYEDFGPEKKAEQPSTAATETATANVQTAPSAHDEYEKAKKGVEQVGNWAMDANVPPSYPTSNSEEETAPNPLYAPGIGTSSDDDRRLDEVIVGRDPMRTTPATPTQETAQAPAQETEQPKTAATETPVQEVQAAQEEPTEAANGDDHGPRGPLGRLAPTMNDGRFEMQLGSPTDRAKQMQQDLQNRVVANTAETLGMQEGVREFAGTQEVQDQMDSAIKGAVDEVNNEIAKRQSTNMVAAGGGAGMSGVVVYNAARAMSEMAPSKIADAAYGELDRQGIFDQYVAQKYKKEGTTEEGEGADEPKGEDALAELDEARRKEVERIMQKESQVFALEIQQQLVDRYKDSKKVGNAGEYIASSAFLNSIAGRIYQGLASRMGAREYLAMLNENLQGYDAGFATQGAAGAASMILDTPFFMLGGVAGGALTSMATRATTAMLGGTAVRFLSASPVVSGIGRIMQRAISTGGTFAGYETIREGAEIYADEKEYSVLDVVKALGGAAAEGFGTGVALGVIGGIPSEMTRNASRIGRFAGGATGFAGELGYFSYNDMKKYMEENGVEWDEVPVGQILGKQVVMLGLMRMQHIDQIIDRYKSKITKQWGMELTSDDLANLRDAGYWDGKGGLIDAEKFLYKFGSESYDFYRSIMSNDNIPLSTRAKLRYIVEGKMSPMGAAFDRDGNVYAATDPVTGSYDVQTVEKDGTYYVTTFDENGRVMQVLRFKNKKEATNYHNAVAGQVTVNVVRCGEMALGKMDPEALRQCKERFNNRMSGNKRIGNIDDILAKPFDQRSDAENALVADYGKELFWISTLPKEDPTLRLIEERTDAETGTFKQGTDKDGRPVTVKGEGETVVTTDMETGEVKMQRADGVVIESEGTPEEVAAEAQQAAADAAAAAAMTPQEELAATKAANAELAKQQHDTAPFFLHDGDNLVPLSDIQKRVDGTGYDVFDMNGEKIGTVAAEMIEDGDAVRQAEALQAEAEAKRAEEEARKAAEKAAEEAAKAEEKRIAERDKAAKDAIEKAANTVELDRLAENWTEEMPAEIREAWQVKRDKFVADEEAEREAKFLAEKEETSYTEAVDKVKAWDDSKIDATIEKAEKGLASDDLTDEQEAQTKGVLKALKEEKARREEERKLSYDPKSNKWRGVPGDIEIISSGKPSNKIGEIRGFTPNINIDLIYNGRIGHTSARVYIQDANAESPHKITERLEKEGYELDNSGEMGPYADFPDWDAAVGFEKHVREIEAEVQKEREKRNAPAPDWTIDTAKEARERGYRMVNGERVERHAPVNHVVGGRRTVKFSDKTQDNVKGKYAVMDVKDLTPSHVNGHRNPEFFITEAQPKDRVDAASKVAATVIANNINPEEITGGVTAYTGSPVVNNRGEVIQGNNRSEALRLMTDESKKKYRDYLNEHSEDFGIYPEDLDGFENPVLVRMLDVSDEEAIRLGQMNAQDTESGGKQAIDPKTLITKLQNVKMLEGFLNAVMKGADDNDALTDLIVKNGYNALKYAREKDAINDTQLITYWDDKLKGLTPEGKVVVNGVFNSLLFEGGSEDLPTFFAALPKAAQRAILTIIPNELRVEPGKSIREKVQRAIQLYYNAKQGGGKTPKDYKSAIKFAQEANINPNMYGVTLNFDNFAVELAARIAYETQATLIARFAKYYQLANGTYSDMFVNDGKPEPPKNRKDSFEGAFDTTTKLEDNENRQSTTGPVRESDDTGRGEGRPAVAADTGGVGRNEPGREPATDEGAARGVGEGAPAREVKKAEQPRTAATETPAEEPVKVIKGEKWNKTGEPKKFVSGNRKRHDDAYIESNGKKYGGTKGDIDVVVMVVDESLGWGSPEKAWNAYEKGEVLLGPEQAAILKRLVEDREKGATKKAAPTKEDVLKAAQETGHLVVGGVPPVKESKKDEEPTQPEGKGEVKEEKEQPKAEQPKDEPKAEEPKEEKKHNFKVSDEEMDDLAAKIRAKFGRLNIGADPELLTLGIKYAFGKLERGVVKFADFCKEMVDTFGDAIRPYLKQFYNSAKDDPEMTEDLLNKMDSYEAVRAFDVMNFDKATVDNLKKVAEDTVKKAEEKKNVKPQTNKDNGIIRERSQAEDRGLGEGDRTKGEQPESGGVAGRDGERAGMSEVRAGGVAGQPTRSEVEAETEPKEKLNQNNYHEERDVNSSEDAGIPKTIPMRFDANLDALELLARLRKEGRQATEKERMILGRFSGFGGLGGMLERVANGVPDSSFSSESARRKFEKLRERFEAIGMTRDELRELAKSANTAFYTPDKYVDTMWDIAMKLGYKGGRMLEGSAGIGRVLARIPGKLNSRSMITAVEIDPSTGEMLQHMYPDAKVHIAGFEKVDIPPKSVDLVMTNVPFGQQAVSDDKNRDLARMFGNLHDFCIAKNVRALKEGGIGIFITTSGTMDKSAKLRKWVTGQGDSDFIGAFRLPNNTFGGTGVTSDIIVIRKRVNGVKSENAIDVQDTVALRIVPIEKDEVYSQSSKNYNPDLPVSSKNHRKGQKVVVQQPLQVNKYFVDHPEMMGGEMFLGIEKGDTYRPASSSLYPKEGQDIDKMMKAFVDGLKPEKAQSAASTDARKTRYTDAKEGTMSVEGGKVYVARRGENVEVPNKSRAKDGTFKGEDGKRYSQETIAKDYLGLKKALHDVLDYQLKNEGDEGLQPLLDVLNKQYDRFKQRYGNLHGNNPRVAWLGADNDFYSVQSLEKYSESKSMTGKVTVKTDKSDIMLGRVLNMQRDPEPKNAREAVIASINMKGDINPGYIAEKLGLTREEAEKQILDSGLGFREPESGNIEPSFVYLSGNVREKLKTAYVNSGLTEYGEPIAGVERTHDYDKNIEALRSVVPVDLPAHAISFGLGTTWIPAKIYADYIKETFGFDATPVMSGGNWVIPGADNHNPKNAVAGVVSDKLRTGRYGDHMRFMGAELMEAAMNNRSVQFVRTWKDSDGNSHTEYDKEATQRANTIIGDMKGAFMEWGAAKMQSDAEMAEQVRRIYNEKFNAVVPFKIGDEFLPEVYPGQVSELGGRPFRLMEHQRRAVMRNILYPTLMDHEAGTGKTFTFITTAMEMRRIGTAKKPLIVVQNATVEQFSSSAKKIYPDAKVLTIGGGMTPTERKGKFEALRYNDWDMVIMAQSVFEEIPDSQASRMEYMQEKMEEIEQMVAAAKSAKTGASAATQAVLNNTIRDLERQKNEIIEKFSVNEAQTAPEDDKIDKRKEKSRANAEAKAEQMMARKTDDVATFDDFGVDALMLDEAHNYKNFPITTSMTRGVKGIPKSQSKRSVSVYLKTRDILRKNGGKNVIMGTGTPISNTAGEMWVFMKYLLSKDVLEANAIDMFDNFVRNFGSIETLHEFGASGRYKESNRFASYQNIPELMRLWTICTDIVQAQDVVDDKLPDVINGEGKVISGGINENPTDVFLEQSPSVLRLMRSIQSKLEWYDSLEGSDKKDNSAVPIRMFLLASRLAIDPRLVDRNAPDEPVSKVNRAVDDIVKDLEKTKSYRGTVAVFCEQNTRWDYVRDANGEIVTDPNGKPRKVAGFNVFDDMKKKLVARGVPENEIAIIRGGATKAEKKQRERIFEMVNSGEIRVIMGSEQTVGTGVNIQERMHLGIHLDVPQKPSGYEQENKRIIRQGNLHKEWGIPVQIIRYGIKDTMDVTAYQMLNTKAKFIRSISDAMRFIEDPLSDRTIVDDDETTFGNTVAQLSGSEAAMLKNDAERAARKYETYEKQWKAGQAYAQNTIERGEKTVETFTNVIANTKEQKAEIAKLFPSGKIETIKLDGVECKTKEEIDAQFKELNKTLAEFDELKRNDSGFNDQTIRIPLEINGVKTRIFVKKSRLVDFDAQTREMKGRIVTDISTELPGIGGISVMGKYPKEVLNALEPFISGAYFDDEISRLESHIEYTKREMEQARPLLGQPFKFAKELDATRRAVAELDKKMREEMAEKEARYSDQLQGMDIPDIDDIIRGMADEDEDEADSGDEAMYGESDDSFVGRLRRQANETIERRQQERQERDDMVDEVLSLKYDGDETAIAATKMALTALDRATGGRVVYETDESVEKAMSEKAQPNTAADGDATEMRTSDGTVYGWKDGRGVIHLSLDGLNADTPVHEYSHLWFEVLKRRNRELWQSVMDRVREALNTADSEGEEVRRVLDEILGDENYKNIRDDEERLTSEILARLSGKKGRERMNEAAREAVKNRSFSWKVKSAIYDVLDKLKDAVAKAWNWIGKNIFRADSDVKSFSNIDEITDRVLYDFLNGTDMGPDGGGGGGRREYSIGGRRSPEVEARQSILDMKGVKEVQDLATELKRLTEKQGWHLEDRPTGLKDGAGNPIMRKVWTASIDPNTIKMAAEDALRFVRDKVSGVLSKELGAMELKKILRDIAAASTSQELGRPLFEVSRIINDAIIRKVERQTNELMATKVEKLNDRGVPVGRLVDVEGRNLFNEIRKANTEILTTSVDTDLDRVKKEYNNLVTRRRRLAAGNPKEEDEAYWDATTNTYDSAHMAALEADISAKEIELEGLRAKHTSDIEANIAEAYDKLAADRDRLENEIGAYNSAGSPVPPEVIEEYCTVLPIRENLAIMHEARLELAQIKKEWQQALDDLHSIKRAPGYMAARKAKQRECDNLEANYMIQQGVIRDAMIAVAEGVKTILDEGKDRLTLIREQELEHKKFLVADAIDDVKRPNLKVTHQEKADSAENPMWYRVVNTLADPMKSLNFMLQWIDENHANGEGKLYTRFMKDPEGVVGANDRLWQQKKKTRTDMDAKVLDVFGKKMGVNALQKKGGDSPFLKLGRDSKKELGVDIEKYVSKKELTSMQSNKKVHPDVIGRFSSPDDVIDGYHKIRVKGLTKGNALYIWLTWQQADGQEKLVRMGYNQDSIDQIERALGPEYIEFARWITDDYLKGLRDKYFSPRHEELFGISMGDTPHYFPLKIDKSTVFDKRQIGEDQKNYMPSLMVPNLIKRNRNNSEIDTTTDALEVLNRYTDTMWQWWAMGPIIKDVNTLHASPRFKEYMEANRKGSFAELMKAFEVATGATAERERDVVNDIVGKLTSAGATAAIAFKTSIALKQFLSFDAFRAYSADPRFQAELTKNILTPWACMKWAYETLPSYEQRRDEGDMGMEFMRQENMFDVARYISKAGLYANRFIDRWTVAAGAKAVYDYSMRKLLSEGWDKNKAHRWSVIEAEITFNKSQQSSRPEFSSWAQKNGNAFTRSLLLFTNGPTGYARQIRLAQWNLYKMAQAAADGKVKGWSKRELHGNGSHHKAWTAAGALAAIAIFGLVLPSEWQLGGNTNNVSDIASPNTEMNDADWEAYKWAIAEGLLTDGTYIGSAVKSVVNGYDYEPIHLLNMINEIKDMAQEGEADPIMAHIVDTALKYQLGLDINTFATIWAGVKGMVTADYDSETLPMDLYLNLLLMLHSNKTDRRGWARELYSKYGPTAYAKAYEKASMQNNTDRKVTQLAHEYVKNLNEDFYNDMMEWKPLTEEHNAKVTTPERRAEIEAMPEWQLAARYKDWIIPTMRANMLQQDSTGVAVKNNPNRYLSDSEIVNILNNEMIPQWKEFKKSQKDEDK